MFLKLGEKMNIYMNFNFEFIYTYLINYTNTHGLIFYEIY